MLDGRVKTLHPRIHAGILADRRKPEHETQLADQGIEPFDLVIVNLYPFRETVASGAAEGDVIEKIDIGGPAMVRAAAKNFASVGVVVSPSRYAGVVEAIRADGGLSLEQRRDLAAEAFAHTAAYDAAVAGWFASDDAAMPTFVGLAFEKVADLRYGENPHQHGALYRGAGAPGVLGGADVLVEGKEMSFNNWLDVDAALTLAADLERLGPAAVIVKHNNPCGAAVQGSPAASYAAAFDSDTVSAFGGSWRSGARRTRTRRGRWPTCSPRSSSLRRSPTGRSGRSRNARGCAWSEPRCPNPVASTCGCCTGARSSRTPTRHPRAGPSWRSYRSGSPPRTNGATCGSRGSSRCA
jgi:AICAR transformylase/IMP cyclohydrolase PurH